MMKKIIVGMTLVGSLNAVANPLIPIGIAAGAALFSSGCKTKTNSDSSSEIERLKQEILVLRSEKESCETELDQKKQEYAECEFQLRMSNMANSGKDFQIERLEGFLSECQTDVFELNSMLEECNQDVESCDSQNEFLEGQVSSLQEKVDSFESIYSVKVNVCNFMSGNSGFGEFDRRIGSDTWQGVFNSFIQSGAYVLVDQGFQSEYADYDYVGNYLQIGEEDSESYDMLKFMFETAAVSEFEFLVDNSAGIVESISDSVSSLIENAQYWSDFYGAGITATELNSCLEITYEPVSTIAE